MRICTDSFTPRRLRTIRAIMVRYSHGSFQGFLGVPEKAEYHITTGRNGSRNSQHVVQQQSAGGDHADTVAKQFGCNQVSAAAAGKLLNDVAVTLRR